MPDPKNLTEPDRQRHNDPADPLVLDLARALAALLRSAGPAANAGATYYSSTALPPGVSSRRAFAARCKTIPAARREGRGWVVAAVDWFAARAPAPPPDDSAETLLAAAGVRLRGRR